VIDQFLTVYDYDSIVEPAFYNHLRLDYVYAIAERPLQLHCLRWLFREYYSS